MISFLISSEAAAGGEGSTATDSSPDLDISHVFFSHYDIIASLIYKPVHNRRKW